MGATHVTVTIHIVNASLRPVIEGICRAAEYDPPILCTPEELLEVGND